MNIDINDLPEELTIDLYAFYNADMGYVFYRDEEECYSKSSVLISEPITVTFKTLDRDTLVSKTVDNLKAESQKIRADAEVKCKQIDEKINSLLALEAK